MEKYSKKQMESGYEVLDNGEMRRERRFDRYKKMFDMSAEEHSPGGFLSRPGSKSEIFEEDEDDF